MTRAPAGPSPKTVWVAGPKSGHRWQSAASRVSFSRAWSACKPVTTGPSTERAAGEDRENLRLEDGHDARPNQDDKAGRSGMARGPGLRGPRVSGGRTRSKTLPRPDAPRAAVEQTRRRATAPDRGLPR